MAIERAICGGLLYDDDSLITEDRVLKVNTDKIATKQYVDDNSGGDGSGGVFDLIIRTQAEFEAMCESPTWLDAKSVCFVGGGYPSNEEDDPFMFTSADGIEIPPTVINIQGLHGAIIKIENSTPNSVDANIYRDGALYYWDTPDLTTNSSIDGLTLLCNAPHLSVGFNNCVNVTNCFCASAGEYKGIGFYRCKKLINCSGVGISDDIEYCCVFDSCDYLTNCAGVPNLPDTCEVFRDCTNVTTTSITMNGETKTQVDGNIDLGNVAVIEDSDDFGTGIAIDSEHGTVFMGDNAFISVNNSGNFHTVLAAEIPGFGTGGLMMSGSYIALLSVGELGLQQLLPLENNPTAEYLATQPWVNQAIADSHGGEFVTLHDYNQPDGYTQDISPTNGGGYWVSGQFGEIAIELPTLSNGERCSFVMYVEIPSTPNPEITYTSSGLTQIQGGISFDTTFEDYKMKKVLYNGYGVSNDETSETLWFVDCSDIGGIKLF